MRKARDGDTKIEGEKCGASSQAKASSAEAPQFWNNDDLLELSVLSDRSRMTVSRPFGGDKLDISLGDGEGEFDDPQLIRPASQFDGLAAPDARKSAESAQPRRYNTEQSANEWTIPLSALAKDAWGSDNMGNADNSSNMLGSCGDTSIPKMPTRPLSPPQSRSTSKALDTSLSDAFKTSGPVASKVFKVSKSLVPPDPARESLHARGMMHTASLPSDPPPSAEERAERLEALATPSSNKAPQLRPGPLYGTDRLSLSLDGVEALRKRSTSSYLRYCDVPAKSKLRITSRVVIGDNEEPSSVDLMRASVPHLTVMAHECMLSTAPRLLPGGRREPRLAAADKARRDEAEAAAVEAALFGGNNKSDKDQRIVPDYVMRYKGFMHRFSFGFICIVFDFHMGVLATLDLESPKTIPGLTICPPNLLRGGESKRFVNLIEIDTAILPKNVFAILPIVFDDADRLDSDLTLVMELQICLPPDANVNKKVGSTSNYAGWSHICPELSQFRATRAAEARTPRATSDIKSTKTPVEFFAHGGYAPMALVRGIGPQKDWGAKALHAVVEGPKLPNIIESAVQALIRASCTPMAVMHIEHCCDCTSHSLSTWHVPGSYEKLLDDLRRELRDRMPPMLVYSNQIQIKKSDAKLTNGGHSRIGSFEISLRPYYSSVTQQLFSKLSARHLPSVEDVLSAVSGTLIPDKMYFKELRNLRVRVYNAYLKNVVKEGRVKLYKVNVFTASEIPFETMVPFEYVSKPSDGFGDWDDIDGDDADRDADEVFTTAAIAPPSILASAKMSTIRPKSSSARSRDFSTHKQMLATTQRSERLKDAIESKALPTRRSAVAEKPKGLYKSVMTSESVQDAAFRHSLPFCRVRSWGADDVARWFKSHGVSNDVVAQAQLSGVYDGVSLMALANKVTLRDWGVRSKPTLIKLEESLAAMATEYSSTDYDPHVRNASNSSEFDGTFIRAIPAYGANYGGRDPDAGRSFELIDDVPLNAKGRIDFNIDQMGSYILKVTSPTTETFWSKVFSFNAAANIDYGLSIKPLLVPVFLQVRVDADAVSALDGVPHSHRGVLISVVNIQAGRRHISLADFNNTYSSQDAEKNDSEGTRRMRLSSVYIEQRQGSLVDLLSKQEVSKNHPLSQKGPSGSLNSAGKLQFARARRRNEGIIVGDKNLAPPSGERFIISLLWLPEGTYYSEVDGSVFRITPPENFEGYSNAADNTVSPEILQSYSLKQAIKCHKRLVRVSVRGFQMVYRKYKKSFLALQLNAFFTLKRASRRIRERVHRRVIERRATMLQSWVRMVKLRSEFKQKWHAVVYIQARIRGLLCKLRRRKMALAKWTLSTHLMMWIIRRRIKRARAATKIQNAYRCFCARRLLNCLQFAKRYRPRLRRYLRGVRTRIRATIVGKAIKRLEVRENQLMAAEEEHMRRHLAWLRLEERKKVVEKLALIERKRNRAASVIQARLRGMFIRDHVDAAQGAIARLQRVFLLRRYVNSFTSDGASSKNDFRRKKKHWRFKALSRHPELIGCALLLAGIPVDPTAPYNMYRESKRRFRPDASSSGVLSGGLLSESGFGGGDDESATSQSEKTSVASRSRGRADTLHSEVNEFGGYDPDYLLYCVTKIQSAVRMHLCRRNYLAYRGYPTTTSTRTGASSPAIRSRSQSGVDEVLPTSDGNTFITNETEAEERENLSNYYPGYYLEDGRYIYYQKDEVSGFEYFGYYDADGSYVSYEGEYSKVHFPPQISPLDERRSAPTSPISPSRTAAPDKKSNGFSGNQMTPLTIDNDAASSSPKRSPVSSTSPKLLSLFSGGLLGSKPPKTPVSERQKNTPVRDSDGYLVDDIVSIQSDDESVREVNETDGRNQSSNSLMAGLIPRLNSKQLLRPWSFLSDVSADTAAPADNGGDDGGASVVSENSQSPSRSGALGNAMKGVLSASAKVLTLTGSAIKHKAALKSSDITNVVGSVASQLKSNAEKRKAEKERLLRIKNYKFEANDALLMLSGTVVEDAVRLNRAWFIAIFPQTTDVFADLPNERLAQVVSRSREEQEYEMRNGRNVGESVRSKEYFPLSKDGFQSFVMYAHLAELARYVCADVCLFVEVDDDPLLRSDLLPADDAGITQAMRHRNAERSNKQWFPAFRGEFQLNEGASFGPSGGRVNVLLKPIINDGLSLTRAQARRISYMDGFLLSVALLPVAIPSMPLLRSLASPTAPVTMPDHIIDAILMQKYKSDSVIQEPSLCAVYFKDRMLVSARAKGEPIGLLEYNANGEYIGRVTSHVGELGTVSHLLAGFRHVIACSVDGMMGVFSFRRGTNTWNSPRIMYLHDHPVVFSAAVHRSGIDFFFTVDKLSNVGVVVMEEGRILISSVNDRFTSANISSIAAFANILYIGQVDGGMYVLDLKTLLLGDFGKSRVLESMVIFSRGVMPNKTSITSLAVVATNSHAYLSTEDPSLGRNPISPVFPPSNESKASMKTSGFDSSSILKAALHGLSGGEEDDQLKAQGSVLEGHLVIVGGGDGDPRVRVLRLKKCAPVDIDTIELNRKDGKADVKYSFYEVATLRGHTRAVHSIVVDAAGRFIITASRDDKTILVWNALTYTCEKLYNDAEFGSMHGGPNCLFLCSFKPPFLTAFTVPKDASAKSRSASHREAGADATSAGDNAGVSMLRSPQWCAACVRGDSNVPAKSIVKVSEDLGEPGRSIVALWRRYHAHNAGALARPTNQDNIFVGDFSSNHYDVYLERGASDEKYNAASNVYKWLGGYEKKSFAYDSDEIDNGYDRSNDIIENDESDSSQEFVREDEVAADGGVAVHGAPPDPPSEEGSLVENGDSEKETFDEGDPSSGPSDGSDEEYFGLIRLPSSQPHKKKISTSKPQSSGNSQRKERLKAHFSDEDDDALAAEFAAEALARKLREEARSASPKSRGQAQHTRHPGRRERARNHNSAPKQEPIPS